MKDRMSLSTLAVALDALYNKERWYRVRGHKVPDDLVKAIAEVEGSLKGRKP